MNKNSNSTAPPIDSLHNTETTTNAPNSNKSDNNSLLNAGEVTKQQQQQHSIESNNEETHSVEQQHFEQQRGGLAIRDDHHYHDLDDDDCDSMMMQQHVEAVSFLSTLHTFGERSSANTATDIRTYDDNMSTLSTSKNPLRGRESSTTEDGSSTYGATFHDQISSDLGDHSQGGEWADAGGGFSHNGMTSSINVQSVGTARTTTTDSLDTTGINNPYAMHKYLLYFLDPEVEQRYYNFHYVDNMFLPGKLFALLWTNFLFMSFIVLTQPFSNGASYTVESFTSLWFIGSYISGGISSIMFVGLFIDRLKPYREALHLVQIFVGWPTFALEFIVLKRPIILVYSVLQTTHIFCMLIAQARVCRSLLLVTVWPTICMTVVTFGVPNYWNNHTKVEMMYWFSGCIPVILLFFLERLARKAFMDREVATSVIAEIEHKTLVTQ